GLNWGIPDSGSRGQTLGTTLLRIWLCFLRLASTWTPLLQSCSSLVQVRVVMLLRLTYRPHRRGLVEFMSSRIRLSAPCPVLLMLPELSLMPSRMKVRLAILRSLTRLRLRLISLTPETLSISLDHSPQGPSWTIGSASLRLPARWRTKPLPLCL